MNLETSQNGDNSRFSMRFRQGLSWKMAPSTPLFWPKMGGLRGPILVCFRAPPLHTSKQQKIWNPTEPYKVQLKPRFEFFTFQVIFLGSGLTVEGTETLSTRVQPLQVTQVLVQSHKVHTHPTATRSKVIFMNDMNYT